MRGEEIDNKFNNFCNQDDNFNDDDLVVGESVAGNNVGGDRNHVTLVQYVNTSVCRQPLPRAR